MANASKQPTVDWANLPEEATNVSLWEVLHDGCLIDVISDLKECTISLLFEVDYVREFNNLPDGTTFNLQLSGVRSVRSLRTRPWPGSLNIPTGVSREEESKLVAAYQSKCREESEDWFAFEQAVKADASDSPEVLDANLAVGTSEIALRLGVLITDGSYRDVFLRADSLNVGTSNGRQFTLDEFLGLGKAYWDAFAARRKKT